jgi:uncharacterized membrane protein YcgQ (UPF0703/DUF1980 family)
MKLLKQQQFHSHQEPNNQGFVMIISVLIVTALISVILIKTSLNSISVLNTGSETLNSTNVSYFTEGCANEALIKLSRDNNYAGSTFDLEQGTCTVVVAGNAVEVTGTLFNYSQTIDISFTLDPFTVDSWDN